MTWKPIVIGVDASPEAAGAAAVGFRLAAAAQTTCHLVHATRDLRTAFATAQLPERAREFSQAVIEQAREQVRDALRGIAPGAALRRMVVRPGRAPVVLKQAVAEFDAELVVLGGKHHSALGRWLAGSTSLNVARTTEVPMLVTRTAPSRVRRVLAAVDLSAAARPTLATAQRYADLLSADLQALSVLEPLPVIPNVESTYDSADYYALLQELLERDVWPHLTRPGARRLVRHGMAVETILRQTTEWQADLLVVGSHGKGWAERVLMGSVTEELLNHLPTSLLVVPIAQPASAPSIGEQPRRDSQPRAVAPTALAGPGGATGTTLWKPIVAGMDDSPKGTP